MWPQITRQERQKLRFYCEQIFFSFYCKQVKLVACLYTYKTKSRIQNLHQQESSSLCLLREEWSGLATKFCLLVIYSRPGGSNHKHGVNFWLQIFLSLSSRLQINLGRSQKLSVFKDVSIVSYWFKFDYFIAVHIQRQPEVQTLKTKCWLLLVWVNWDARTNKHFGSWAENQIWGEGSARKTEQDISCQLFNSGNFIN